jgi:hypothetical protein
MLDRRPFSFEDIESFEWETPIADRIRRLTTTTQQDFDEK